MIFRDIDQYLVYPQVQMKSSPKIVFFCPRFHGLSVDNKLCCVILNSHYESNVLEELETINKQKEATPDNSTTQK